VVWGMPGAIVSAGIADRICPLPKISGEVVRRVSLNREQLSSSRNQRLAMKSGN
jgi:chemotaxis response regulator CheB